MTWDLMGEELVGFEWRQFDAPMIGNEVIKIEHSYDYASFPGFGHAVLSNIYVNNERDLFFRSYPYKDNARIYELDVPERLYEANYLLHFLQVRRNIRAKVQANANWRVRAYLWFGPNSPTIENDGNPPDLGESANDLDGNPLNG